MCLFIQLDPPLYVPLVKVIPSVYTSQEVVQKTVVLMKDLGKAPIVEKKELNGFVIQQAAICYHYGGMEISRGV